MNPSHHLPSPPLARRPASLAALLATALLLSAGAAWAQPTGGTGSIGDALTAADMTFTLEEAEAGKAYNVTTPGGYTFKLVETGDEMDLIVEDVLAPRSGVWSFQVETGRVSCPVSATLEGLIPQLIESGRRSLARLMGSPDQGRSISMEFSEPFSIEQLLNPMAEALTLGGGAGNDIEVRYPGWNEEANVHTFQGSLRSDDAVTVFKGEIGVVSENLMMGWLTATNDFCSVQLFPTFWRTED